MGKTGTNITLSTHFHIMSGLTQEDFCFDCAAKKHKYPGPNTNLMKLEIQFQSYLQNTTRVIIA